MTSPPGLGLTLGPDDGAIVPEAHDARPAAARLLATHLDVDANVILPCAFCIDNYQ